MTNSFLVGMDSEHHDGYEDRVYKFYYQNSKTWVLSNCEWVDTNKDYDGKVEHKLEPDQVIAGNKYIEIPLNCVKFGLYHMNKSHI